MSRPVQTNPASPVLFGSARIAAFLGVSPRMVWTLVERHDLPVAWLGGEMWTRKGLLLAWVREYEDDDAQDPPAPGHAGGWA